MANKQKSGEVKSGKSMSSLSERERKIFLTLRENPEGLRVETINKLTDIPTRTIYRILKKHSGEGGIVLNNYPLWKKANGKVDFWQSLSKHSNIFELHNLGYVVHLVDKPDWWNKRKSVLMRLKDWQFSNHNFGKNNSNPYQQLINEDFVIQTYQESIIIIHRKNYWSNDPYEVIIEGIKNNLNILKYLQERFRFNFFPSGVPNITLRGNDFNRVADHLAKYCKKEGKRFLVETDIGKCYVDYSEPFGKEADTPDIQNTLEKHTKDLIVNKPMTNSELQEIIKQNTIQISSVTNNQMMFAKNIESHIQAIKDISTAVNKLTEKIERLDKDKL